MTWITSAQTPARPDSLRTWVTKVLTSRHTS